MDTRKPLGRGQALQRVMDHSISNLNVTGMIMDDYTNEKIVAFLEKVSESNEFKESVTSIADCKVENSYIDNPAYEIENGETYVKVVEEVCENRYRSFQLTGPPAQHLPSQNLALQLENKESEKACLSPKTERIWKTIEPSTSTKSSTMHEDPCTKSAPKVNPGQFNFTEEDFPPL